MDVSFEAEVSAAWSWSLGFLHECLVVGVVYFFLFSYDNPVLFPANARNQQISPPYVSIAPMVQVNVKPYKFVIQSYK